MFQVARGLVAHAYLQSARVTEPINCLAHIKLSLPDNTTRPNVMKSVVMDYDEISRNIDYYLQQFPFDLDAVQESSDKMTTHDSHFEQSLAEIDGEDTYGSLREFASVYEKKDVHGRP